MKKTFEYKVGFPEPEPTSRPRDLEYLNPGGDVCWVVMTDSGVTSCVVFLQSEIENTEVTSHDLSMRQKCCLT